MSAPTFSILLPVTRPPHLIGFAIESVLAQTHRDFELIIVSDGAPIETLAMADAYAARDLRIRVQGFPKGQRHGEAHRHTVLSTIARGRLVCQIGDDDLWFPNHLAEMAILLSTADFGNTLHTYLATDGTCRVHFADLADKRVQARMLAERFNFFGPTVAGYRLEAYHRLEVGWSPAPEDVWTDLFMWRKFLSLPDIVVGTRFEITAVNVTAKLRQPWTIEQRQEEAGKLAEQLKSERWRDNVRQSALRSLAR